MIELTVENSGSMTFAFLPIGYWVIGFKGTSTRGLGKRGLYSSSGLMPPDGIHIIKESEEL